MLKLPTYCKQSDAPHDEFTYYVKASCRCITSTLPYSTAHYNLPSTDSTPEPTLVNDLLACCTSLLITPGTTCVIINGITGVASEWCESHDWCGITTMCLLALIPAERSATLRIKAAFACRCCCCCCRCHFTMPPSG